MNVETLKSIGGSEWIKEDKHRVYFNDLAGFFGLSCNRYNTGNISSATLDGEKISNSRASEISGALGGSKVWYDVKDGQFHYKVIGCRTYSGDTMGDAIVEEIKRRAAAAEVEAQ